jgi:transcriptional regulator of acetoin/glycerol metabolism
MTEGPDRSLRDVALENSRQLLTALTDVVAAFQNQSEVSAMLVEALASDTPMTAIVQNFAVAAERDRMTSALSRYETLRRETRLAIWRALQAEGCSIGEISRMFGLSRQLVSRQLST